MSKALQQQAAFLMFASLSEVLLGLYENTRLLSLYDPALENKLKNIKVNFERISSKFHGSFSEDEIKSFYKMANIFEALLEAAKSKDDFQQLMDLIEAWQKKEITVINTKEELKQVAWGE